VSALEHFTAVYEVRMTAASETVADAAFSLPFEVTSTVEIFS